MFPISNLLLAFIVISKLIIKNASCLQACAVMALERVPADIRKDGGVSRMSDPKVGAVILMSFLNYRNFKMNLHCIKDIALSFLNVLR